jgi:SOS-response transcriptional repressor LexA
MNDRWQLVFDFIKAYTRKNGVGPSYAVLASGLGMKSRANMHRIVKRLEKEGLLQTKPKKFYSIKVVDKSISEITSL